MGNLKERLEKERLKLQIYKQRLLGFNREFHIEESFVIEKEKDDKFQFYYDITQNLYSLSLILSSCFSFDATTYFFIELFNFYQDLPIENVYPYHSNSQSITTYCLKELARKKLIYLLSCEKGILYDLDSYMEMFGIHNYPNINVQMYHCYFYKKRNLTKKNILLLKSIARILHIDLSNLTIVPKNQKIYLKMKSCYKCHQLLSGEYFKNIYRQREYFFYLIKEYKNYLTDNEYGRKRNNKFLLKRSKSLYNKNT